MTVSAVCWWADQSVSPPPRPTALSASDQPLPGSDKKNTRSMNCEMNVLSAIFSVHWTKKLYKMTHLSASVQIIEIHQFPHCASVIRWTLLELNYILISSLLLYNDLRYRSAAVMGLDFLRSPEDSHAFWKPLPLPLLEVSIGGLSSGFINTQTWCLTAVW